MQEKAKAVWKVETQESKNRGEVYRDMGFPGGSRGKNPPATWET